jgi:hypothetical protein
MKKNITRPADVEYYEQKMSYYEAIPLFPKEMIREYVKYEKDVLNSVKRRFLNGINEDSFVNKKERVKKLRFFLDSFFMQLNNPDRYELQGQRLTSRNFHQELEKMKAEHPSLPFNSHVFNNREHLHGLPMYPDVHKDIHGYSLIRDKYRKETLLPILEDLDNL